MIIKVEITETLQTICEISAESEDEALETVQALYDKQEIVLGAENHTDTTIQVRRN